MKESDTTKWVGLLLFWFLNIIGVSALFDSGARFLPWHYYILFYSMPLYIYYKGAKGYHLKTSFGFEKEE